MRKGLLNYLEIDQYRIFHHKVIWTCFEMLKSSEHENFWRFSNDKSRIWVPQFIKAFGYRFIDEIRVKPLTIIRRSQHYINQSIFFSTFVLIQFHLQMDLCHLNLHCTLAQKLCLHTQHTFTNYNTLTHIWTLYYTNTHIIWKFNTPTHCHMNKAVLNQYSLVIYRRWEHQ